MKNESWINNIDTLELYLVAQPVYFLEGSKPLSIDDAARLISKEGLMKIVMSVNHRGDHSLVKERNLRPPLKYWSLVKNELVSLFCSDDQKYNELREKLSAEVKGPKDSALTLISLYLGGKLGVDTGMIVGFVAICLFVVAKLGVNALCLQINGAKGE